MSLRKSQLPGFLIYILVIFFFIFDFQDYLGREPQSIHHWRQSDGASIALNYYQHGMDFFQPEIHFQASDNSSSGYGVGEFPILYYITAGLYHLFGPLTPILRILNCLIFFLGIFYLFKGLKGYLESKFWAYFIITVFISSPVILYYSNNYLPNIPSLSLVFIAWYHIGKYQKNQLVKHIWLSSLFFCLAGLLKITALISFIPLVGLAIISLLPIGKWQFFKQKTHTITALISVVFINFIWYKWAINYNNQHTTSYFSTHTWPYYSLDLETINKVWEKIELFWMQDYFYDDSYSLLKIALLLFVINLGRLKAFWTYMFSTVLIGSLIYCYLFFLNLMNHDYYIINLYILPILLLVSIVELWKRRDSIFFRNILFKMALICFLYYGINYGKERLHERYYGWMNDMNLYDPLIGIEDFLRNQGIQQEDKFLVIGDPTPNTALYRMNQKGWSDLYNLAGSSQQLNDLIDNKELSYMVILSDQLLIERNYLQPFCSKIRAEYEGVKIYDLRK